MQIPGMIGIIVKKIRDDGGARGYVEGVVVGWDGAGRLICVDREGKLHHWPSSDITVSHAGDLFARSPSRPFNPNEQWVR